MVRGGTFLEATALSPFSVPTQLGEAWEVLKRKIFDSTQMSLLRKGEDDGHCAD
jgi:hypothetical protein